MAQDGKEKATIPSKSFSITIPPKKKDESHLLLSSWNLPESIILHYVKKKITSMFEWQYDCLTSSDVIKGENLVISAPTSAGKMLIGEIVAINSVLNQNKKVVIIQPYVSAVKETESTFRSIFKGMRDVIVQSFTGSHSGRRNNFSDINIGIYTIEKAMSLTSILLQKEGHELGLIIVDELHMIGHKGRGHYLELFLTNILYMNRYRSSQCKIQIMGLSATLPNLDSLAAWLEAKSYQTAFRPIELKEMIQEGNNLYRKNQEGWEKSYTNNTELSQICYERTSEDHSVIIFCSKKIECKKLSKELAKKCPDATIDKLSKKHLEMTCDELKSCKSNVAWDSLIPKGIAYHHADLSMKERAIIEKSFRERHLKVIVATTTLSCGVNLPARLVIVTTPNICGMNALMYQQMIGRAGRKGLDAVGESILMCKNNEKIKSNQLLKCPEPVESRLFTSEDSDGSINLLTNGLLQVLVTAKDSMTQEQFFHFFSCTFYHEASTRTEKPTEENNKPEKDFVEEVVTKFLLDKKFIEKTISESIEDKFQATNLGSITVESNLLPKQVQAVYEELEKVCSSSSIPMIHLIYLVSCENSSCIMISLF